MLSNDERRQARALAAKRKRRRRRIFWGVLLSVLLLAAGVTLCLTVFFKISAVTVTGDEVYAPEQVVEASGIALGENLFLLRAGDAAEQIEATLPYVETAEISRSLSCTVTIHVTRATAAAALDNGDSYTLLSASGKVLEDGVMSVGEDVMLLSAGEVRTRVPGDTVEFAGEHTLEDLQQTLAAFSEAGFTGVTALDLQTHTNIRAVYKGRITLEFGAASSLADKMAFIKATLERSEQTDPTFAGTFDFTIENRAYRNAATEPVPTTVPAQTAAEGNGPDASSETTLQAAAVTTVPA